MRRYVVVDGNVGSGKSTLLDSLGREGLPVIKEPVERWCSRFEHRGEPVDAPLELFYRDPGKYALPFQIHVIESRVRQLLEPAGGSPLVVERDPFDTEVFVEDNYASGAFSGFEHRSFVDLSRTMRRCLPLEHAGSVYLRLGPEACMRRVRERGREAEGGVGIQRLRALHALHEAKYRPCAGHEPGGPRTIVVDAELPPGEIVRIVSEFVRSFVTEGDR